MTENYSIEAVFCDIDKNIEEIREKTARAAQKAGRSCEEIRLMAVTKTVKPIFINHALSKGLDLIGENKVQELFSKLESLEPPTVEKHLIGHLQTNKVAKVLPAVSMIESLDSLRLANEISKCAKKLNIEARVLLEVNVAAEESKTGFLPEELDEAVSQISELDNIKVEGLMSVPPFCETESEIRRYFSYLYKLFIDNRGKKSDNITMNILSMGMSSDYEFAIQEGANLVRIGSALFGARRY